MGCDIHPYVEYRRKGTPRESWWLATQMRVAPRWYWLFNELAGVRGPGDGLIAEPRGLPSDVGYLVRSESEDMSEDGHSHSWVTPGELRQVLRKAESKNDECYVYYQAHVSLMSYWEKKGFEVRMVFWFDN